MDNIMNQAGLLPERIITRRLVLRQYADADAGPVFAMIDRNRERLRQNFAPIANGVRQPEDAGTFVKECADKRAARKEFSFGIWDNSPPILLGQIKVKNIVWEVPSAELSYFIDDSMQRRGFASEAVRAVLRVAFGALHFRRVYLRIIASNTGSLLLAEKLGFKQEGLHRNEFRCGFHVIHDVYHFSLTDADSPSIDY
jgi:RimJ/RimL family protein N-acetyltransferase